MSKRLSNDGRVSLAQCSATDHASEFDLEMFQVRVSWQALKK